MPGTQAAPEVRALLGDLREAGWFSPLRKCSDCRGMSKMYGHHCATCGGSGNVVDESYDVLLMWALRSRFGLRRKEVVIDALTELLTSGSPRSGECEEQ